MFTKSLVVWTYLTDVAVLKLKSQAKLTRLKLQDDTPVTLYTDGCAKSRLSVPQCH